MTACPEGPGRRPRAARLAPWLLLLPSLMITLGFFGLPILYVARMSLNAHIDRRFYVPDLTLDNYAAMVSDPVFRSALLTTLRLAVFATAATVVIGYAFALLVWLKPRNWRLVFVAIALCPMLISEISIIFGWWLFFPKNGLLSYLLVSSGLVSDKISLLYTEMAAFVGLIYITLPFCFFILLSVLDGVDRRILEASADLGAGPIRTFREVLLPLTGRGIGAATAQSFIWAIGTYATPTALGPDTLWTIGYLIQEQMLGRHNWPRAAAFSVVLTVGVAVAMMVLRAIATRQSVPKGR